jgi:SAM-dependent methyltransferase
MPRVNTLTFYTNALKHHGYSPQGVCWLSKKHQIVRFETIASLLPLNIAELSIADAGCGFGDLYNYLCKEGKKPKEYIGIDAHPSMCYIAQKMTEQKIYNQDILSSAKLPFADYYLCSGALNLLNHFETHLFIQKMFNASHKGVIFNFLYGTKQSDIYNYLDDNFIAKVVQYLQVKSFTTVTGYLEADKTVLLLH